MKIRYTINEDDFVAFCNYYYAKTPAGRSGMVRMYIVGGVLFAMFAYSQYDDPTYGAHNPMFYLAHLVLSAIFLGGLYWAYIVLVRPSIIRWMARTGDFRDMLGKVSVEWDAEKAEIMTEKGRGRIPWENIQELAEDKRHYYMILGNLRAFIIPKSAFKNGVEAETAWNQAKELYAAALDRELNAGDSEAS